MPEKTYLPDGTRGAADRLNKYWHLSTSDHEVAITELEFSIFRIFGAFNRWMDDLTACCQNDADQLCSGMDFSLLNVIRMHDRAKSISEVGRLLNRDDLSNLQYSIRKLTKSGFIKKLGSKGNKKGATYATTDRGIEVTDLYARYRKELLLPLTGGIAASDERMSQVANMLTLLSGIYDQAACLAATHRDA
ncbi:MAG: winged helix DNA-binding protein [Gammaproteobacteria bacterium]|nr:winged helix DNA-binding protein [Gammaproteobacteria bacterium]